MQYNVASASAQMAVTPRYAAHIQFRLLEQLEEGRQVVVLRGAAVRVQNGLHAAQSGWCLNSFIRHLKLGLLTASVGIRGFNLPIQHPRPQSC